MVDNIHIKISFVRRDGTNAIDQAAGTAIRMPKTVELSRGFFASKESSLSLTEEREAVEKASLLANHHHLEKDSLEILLDPLEKALIPLEKALIPLEKVHILLEKVHILLEKVHILLEKERVRHHLKTTIFISMTMSKMKFNSFW